MLLKPVSRLAPDFSPPRDVALSHKKRMFPGRDLHHLSHKMVFNHIGSGIDPYDDPPAMRYDESRNVNQFNAAYKSAPNHAQGVGVRILHIKFLALTFIIDTFEAESDREPTHVGS